MKGRTLAWWVFVPWLVTYAYSFVAFVTTAATGDSFTRGLNRIGAFLVWQTLAGVIAIALWVLSGHFDKGTTGRWLCRMPLVLALLLVLAIAGLIVYGNMARPAPT